MDFFEENYDAYSEELFNSILESKPEKSGTLISLMLVDGLRLIWPWPISNAFEGNFLLVESDIKLLNSEERLEEELSAKKIGTFIQWKKKS